MNYRYEISGHLTTDKPIDSELKDFINTFSKTRHCQRNLSALNKAIAQTPNAEKYIKTLIGEDVRKLKSTELFACDQHDELDMVLSNESNKYFITYNMPEPAFPALYCNFFYETQTNTLKWCNKQNIDASPKTIKAWLDWFIRNVFMPLGISLKGTLTYQGEDSEDNGVITVKNNNITIIYEDAYSLKDILKLIKPKTRVSIKKDDSFMLNAQKSDITKACNTTYEKLQYIPVTNIEWDENGIVITLTSYQDI